MNFTLNSRRMNHLQRPVARSCHRLTANLYLRERPSATATGWLAAVQNRLCSMNPLLALALCLILTSPALVAEEADPAMTTQPIEHSQGSDVASSLVAETPIQPRPVMQQSSPSPWFLKKHPVVNDKAATANSQPIPWSQWQHMTGEWDGTRPRLAQKGVLFELVYTAEVMSRVDGGDSSKGDTSGLGNMDLTLTLDTGKLNWWEGGTFFVYLENMVGDGNKINDAVGGPLAPVSTLDAKDFTQLSAYYYEQSLCNGKCRLKFGKQDANSEFATSNITGEFINGGISPPPNMPVPTFPEPALGLLGEINPVNWLSLRAGVYGAELDGKSKSFEDSGLFSGDVIAVLETDITATSLQRYAGTYRFATWFTTLSTLEIVASTNNDPKEYGDNYGVYMLIDQPVYLEPSATDSSGEGLTMFFEYSWAPESRNQINQYFSTGAMYTGAIPTRDSDEIGFAVTYMSPSDNVRPDDVTRNQANFELFYKANITPWLYVQPDVQWLRNVGGADTNAVVVGARVGITF